MLFPKLTPTHKVLITDNLFMSMDAQKTYQKSIICHISYFNCKIKFIINFLRLETYFDVQPLEKRVAKQKPVDK